MLRTFGFHLKLASKLTGKVMLMANFVFQQVCKLYLVFPEIDCLSKICKKVKKRTFKRLEGSLFNLTVALESFSEIINRTDFWLKWFWRLFFAIPKKGFHIVTQNFLESQKCCLQMFRTLFFELRIVWGQVSTMPSPTNSWFKLV